MSQTRKPYHLAPLKHLPAVVLQFPQLLALGNDERDLSNGEHATGAVIGFSEEALHRILMEYFDSSCRDSEGEEKTSVQPDMLVTGKGTRCK